LLRIGNHVEQRKLGGFADHAGYLPLAPDVAAEVVSPSDESSKVESKVRDWLQAGTRVVLVVDPQTESIREYRSSSEIRVYENGTVDLRDILPSTVPVEYVGEWCAVWGDKLRGDDASNWQS
jgi:Uma2 family endonuclease